jgi:hypothetical protein
MSTTIKYNRGKDGSFQLGTTTTPSTLVALPVTTWSTTEKVDDIDETNALTHGYEESESGNRSCSFTFTACWKKTGGAPAFRLGGRYSVALNTQQVSGGTMAPVYEGYSGTARINSLSVSNDIKGGTMYTGSGVFCDVYNSPDYPTAIADAAGSTGDFAPPT